MADMANPEKFQFISSPEPVLFMAILRVEAVAAMFATNRFCRVKYTATRITGRTAISGGEPDLCSLKVKRFLHYTGQQAP